MNEAKTTRIKKWLLTAAGVLALALAALGVVLPGLPTTPFVLLAAACFARASPRLHTWLINHKHLGPVVSDWEKHRSLSLRIKRLSTGLMTVMVLLSAWQLSEAPWLTAGVVVLGILGAAVVWKIPTRKDNKNTSYSQPHP